VSQLRPAFLGALAVVLLPASSLAQLPRTDWWRQNYNVQSGLPSSSILDMAMDTSGFLWLATEGGLMTFDGRNLRAAVKIPEHTAMTIRMRNLIQTEEGGLLATDMNGDWYSMHGFDMAMVMHHPPLKARLNGTVPAPLLKDLLGGSGFLLSSGGLGSTYLFVHGVNGLQGVVHGDTLTRIQDGRVDGHIELPADQGSIFQIGNQAYGFTRSLSPFRLSERLDGTVPVVARWSSGPVQATSDPQVFWERGADEALLLVDQQLFSVRPMGNQDTLLLEKLELELPTQTRISSISTPWERNVLAVGTATKGLYLYQRMHMRTTHCGKDDLPDQAYYAQLDMGASGILTITSGQRGVLLTEEGCNTPPVPLQGAAVSGLAEDAAGWIWTGRAGRTQAYHPETQQLITLTDGATASPTFLVEGDSVWLADRHRLGYVKGFIPHWLNQLGRRDEERPMVIRRLPDGRLCYSSRAGLFVATDRTCRVFDPLVRAQGLRIRAVDVIGERVFLGTYGQGVYLWNGEQFRQLPLDRRGSLSHVHATVADDSGLLWFSTNRGIVSTTLREVLVYMADTTQAPYYAHFGQRAGITEPEMNGGCSPAWIRCDDGRLSFPSMGGAVRFLPEEVPSPYPVHTACIGNVSVDGAMWPIDAYSIFPSATQHVVIPFAAAYWGDPENAQWEYRITGIQEAWRRLDAHQTELLLERPPAGEHEVFIRPVGAEARGIAPELLYWFRVEAPFFTTWPGALLIALGACLVLFLAWRLRSAQLRARNRLLEARVQERTAELTRSLESSATLNAIITHDILTPLNFFARVARGAKALVPPGRSTPELVDTLNDLSSSAEKLHGTASDLLTWMKFNNDRISTRAEELDLHAEIARIVEHWSPMAHKTGITLRNDVAKGTSVRIDKRVLGVIINNLVSNAVVHGGANASIWIDHREAGPDWSLTVHDSGVGIPAVALKMINAMIARSFDDESEVFSRGEMQSLGFAIVISLSRSLGGQVRVESGSNGTQVTITLPKVPTGADGSRTTPR